MEHNMGLGELGKPELVFARRFRFILKAEHLKEDFVHSLEVDLKEKLIVVNIYEIIEDNNTINAHEWADNMQEGNYPDETLTLLVLDGAGNELYTRKFYDLKLIGRKNWFDYDKSDASLTELLLYYKRAEYTGPTDVKHKWHENVETTTEINHLNTKMWVI
jgi:hypothetical protein